MVRNLNHGIIKLIFRSYEYDFLDIQYYLQTRMAFAPFVPLVSMSLLGDASTRRLLRPNLQASTQPSTTSRKPLNHWRVQPASSIRP